MTKRFQISLPDDVAATLEKLAEDCSLPQSIIITQLIRRYHPQLRELLAVDCNLLQLTATYCNLSATYTASSRRTPDRGETNYNKWVKASAAASNAHETVLNSIKSRSRQPVTRQRDRHLSNHR